MNVLPALLEEQVKVLEWARHLKEKHFGVATIIEFLVSNDKVSKHHKGLGIEEMREIYKRYSPSKELVITAILTNHYRLQNDISEGDAVTNGEHVGFAFNIDYESRKFNLFVDKYKATLVASFDMDDFKKIK